MPRLDSVARRSWALLGSNGFPFRRRDAVVMVPLVMLNRRRRKAVVYVLFQLTLRPETQPVLGVMLGQLRLRRGRHSLPLWLIERGKPPVLAVLRLEFLGRRTV